MKSRSKIFPNFKNLKCCYESGHCFCGDEEVVIRNYISGNITDPMTPEQRKWVVDTANYAGKGYYKESELEAMNDKELASATLNAWNMYAQSQF